MMRIDNDLGGEEQMELKHAILLYESNNGTLATIHNVNAAKFTAPVLGPGKALTRAALTATLRKIHGVKHRMEVMPEGVLFYDGGRMVWWTPSARRPIYFATTNKKFNEAVSGKEVLHPPLVFCAEARGLKVWALAENERPKSGTPLYLAPYFNLYQNGSMCAGNAKLPSRLHLGDIPVWEKAFFETNFTHTNVHGGDLVKMSGGHNALWRKMAGPRTKQFPSDALVSLTTKALHAFGQTLTVEDILNQ